MRRNGPVGELAYPDERMIAGGGCEAAVPGKHHLGW